MKLNIYMTIIIFRESEKGYSVIILNKNQKEQKIYRKKEELCNERNEKGLADLKQHSHILSS